jgi:hypothetical protein
VNVIPILVVLCLAGPAADSPAAPAAAPEAAPPREWDKAPPGSPEDVALWNALRDAQNASVVHMARVVQASYRLRYGKYYEMLDEKAKSETPAEAEGARRARARIEAAARDADDAIPKQGLRVRTCKYTLLHLDQRMAIPDDPGFAAEMPAVRAEARGCADELGAFAAKLEPKADALEAALADADAFLKRATPTPPPSPPAGTPAPTSGAR